MKLIHQFGRFLIKPLEKRTKKVKKDSPQELDRLQKKFGQTKPISVSTIRAAASVEKLLSTGLKYTEGRNIFILVSLLRGSCRHYGCVQLPKTGSQCEEHR